MTDAFAPFEYERFAKSWGGARFTLTGSGVAEADLADVLPEGAVAIRGSEMPAATAAWRERIAARYGVPEDHAYPALGTSGAVHLALHALATIVPRGATIAVERPGYGVFESCAHLFGRGIVHVDRRREDGYVLDVDAVERALRDGARVYCVTDLNNPTGVALSRAAVDALHDLGQRHDAWILLDEVYRDFLPGPVGTGYRPGGRVVTTSSLTKCYGLGGLRAGWIFAPPAILERAEQIEELAYGTPPVPTIALAAAALAHADALLQRARAAAIAGRAVMEAWMASTPGVSWVPPAAGITGLVRIDGLTDSKLLGRRLRDELDLAVVPGAWFGAEGSLRVSFGRAPRDVAAALSVLGMGIGPLAR